MFSKSLLTYGNAESLFERENNNTVGTDLYRPFSFSFSFPFSFFFAFRRNVLVSTRGYAGKRLPHNPLISPNNISHDPIAAAIGNKTMFYRRMVFYAPLRTGPVCLHIRRLDRSPCCLINPEFITRVSIEELFRKFLP